MLEKQKKGIKRRINRALEASHLYIYIYLCLLHKFAENYRNIQIWKKCKHAIKMDIILFSD